MASKNLRLGFVGGGNMAGAIIGGLLQAGYSAANMAVSEPWDEARTRLAAQFPGLHITDANPSAVAFGPSNTPVDVLILAVKPQVMKTVAEGIAAAVQTHRPLVITIAAGITLRDLRRWLMSGASAGAEGPALVRCMPNTPALVIEGATGMYAAEGVSEPQKQMAIAVLGAVSKSTYWVATEALLDVVTGVSGSGPAYFFLLVECLEAAGVKLGLPADVARGLAAQTCLGAGRMLVETGEDPAELRRKVTSPKGTTEAAVNSLEASGVRDAFMLAVQRATDRGAELGDILGKQ
ncbi:pyrroline-5-carboxylate reductase dimerization-domain-containing protein [Entophlyctis helioformis]|nr:pyrroline-5-carboxylate reductase dimerization-domain-containing protein [Entophlyctis helioformis]